MVIPCEVAVRSVIPALKALMAKELVEKYGFKQEQVAEMLGVSQSAVSKYTRKIRGSAIRIDNIEEVPPLVRKMTGLLVNRTYRREEFLAFFCQTCTEIRKTALMCQFCRRTDPAIELEECGFCLSLSSREDRR